MTFLGAAAGTVLGLAAAQTPHQFWVDPQGNTTHVWVIGVAAVVGGVAAILVNGVVFVSSYRAKDERFRRAVFEKLALVVGEVDPILHAEYVGQVVVAVGKITGSPTAKNAATAVESVATVPVSQLAVYFHEVVNSWLGKPHLHRVERFCVGPDHREAAKVNWGKNDGSLIGAVWAQSDFLAAKIGGPGDPWSSVEHEAAAYPVVRAAEVVGVVSLTGPVGATLSSLEAPLQRTADTLVSLMTSYDR